MATKRPVWADVLRRSIHELATSSVPDALRPEPVGGLGDATGLHGSGGIHLPDAGFGYYHYYGSDALNTDDWGTLALVNTIEGAGRCWTPRTRRSYRPGDMSLMNGGNFLSQHVDHQNGLDVDVRYVRNDGDTSLVLPGDSLKLDLDATILLWNCFLQSPRLAFLIIDSAYFKQRIIPDKTGRLRFDGTPEHANHFHVGIEDPDGTGN